MMGAEISAKCKAKSVKRIEEYPPITIRGGNLKPITYKMPVASAQVKSAILLAGLYTSGLTQIIEPIKTRDHTERMLKQFKAEIKVKGPAFVKAPAGCPPKRSKGGPNKIVIKGNQLLVAPKNIYIPGDISSASFFLVLASILPNSQIWLRKVSLNPSRAGIIKVLKRMGADIRVTSYELRVTSYEPMGDIRVSSSKLKGTIVKKAEIPSLIDELPILMVAACFAKGKTVFNGVEELRVKETDRIRSMSENLRKMGADIEIYQTAQSEKIIIHGGKRLQGAKVKSFRDHRTALSMIIAGLAAEGKTLIDDISCINKSFPDFLSLLKPLLR
jgi:3-phosphoshikimate 1-carboxyvinyltransferase